MLRQLEEEVMESPDVVRAYAKAHYNDVTESATRQMLELAGDMPNARMIDLGTGPGSIPIMVAKARANWTITAVDASRDMLKIARVASSLAGVGARVKVHQSDAKQTGLPTGGFDVVFSNNFLHHMPDMKPLLDEVKRLAAPGALIYLRDLRRPDSTNEADRLVQIHASEQSTLNQRGFFESLLSAFTVDEIRKGLAEAGMEFLNVEPVPDYFLHISGRMPQQTV